MKSKKILFLSTLVTGTLVSVSAYSWFSAWIGLEMNLMSFIPLMKKKSNSLSSEAAMKYFITQAMASTILLFAVILALNLSANNFLTWLPTNLLIDTALLMKMGAAPFHFWFPEVMSGLSWNNALILMTWQKIAPLVLLAMNSTMTIYLSLIIISSSAISGVQAFNQTCMRKILAYSSINHIGWMLAATLNSMDIWFWYFTIYTLINFNIITIFKNLNILFLSQVSSMFSFNKKLKLLFMMNFMSLGGLPPFLGFLPKWLTVHNLIMNKFYTLTLILVMFTLISLYVYLRISFPSISMTTDESILNSMKKTYSWQIIANFMSVMGLIICAFI